MSNQKFREMVVKEESTEILKRFILLLYEHQADIFGDTVKLFSENEKRTNIVSLNDLFAQAKKNAFDCLP